MQKNNKGHSWIVEHAEEITKMYMETKHKTDTSKHFGISVGGVDRALYTTGNANICSKWFLAHLTKDPSKEPLKIPAFDDMFNFLLDIMGKAEKTLALEIKVKDLEITLCGKNETIHQLSEEVKYIRQLKQQWELKAKGQGIVLSESGLK